MRSAPDQSGIDTTTWQKNIKLRWAKGKEERSTGGGGSELSEGESILEELIEINNESEQRAAEDNYAKDVLENEDKAKANEKTSNGDIRKNQV